MSKNREVIGPSSPKQEMMLATTTDVAVWGGARGSGKSYMSILYPLKYINDPYFRGVIFRKTNSELKSSGGIWETALGVYAKIFGLDRLRVRQQELKITFPSGATLKFSYLENDNDCLKHQGAQYSFILYDKICRFVQECTLNNFSNCWKPSLGVM